MKTAMSGYPAQRGALSAEFRVALNCRSLNSIRRRNGGAWWGRIAFTPPSAASTANNALPAPAAARTAPAKTVVCSHFPAREGRWRLVRGRDVSHSTSRSPVPSPARRHPSGGVKQPEVEGGCQNMSKCRFLAGAEIILA